MKIAVLFSTGSTVLTPLLVQPSSFQWHSSGKILACQPHRSSREKSKFHLDTFWTPLNIILSQASREPVFITGWVQLQRDQGLSLFWVISILMAQCRPRSPLVPKHFPGSKPEMFCHVTLPPRMNPCAQAVNCFFFILKHQCCFSKLFLCPVFTARQYSMRNPVSDTHIWLRAGLWITCQSKALNLTSNTKRDDASALKCLLTQNMSIQWPLQGQWPCSFFSSLHFFWDV